MVEAIKSGPSNSQRTRALEKQVAELQGFMGQLVQGINGTLNEQVSPLNQRIADLEEVVSVLVEAQGAEEVAQAVTARAEARLDASIAKAQANIANGVEKGFLVASDVVDAKSLITGVEVDSSGVPTSSRPWSSFPFNQIRPEVQTGFLGAKVGDSVANANGFFRISEIYSINEAAAKAVIDAPPTEVTPQVAEPATDQAAA
jgi:hypothetical protein